jgi:pyruvate dehydrogenase E1 component alpha subunit
MGTAVHRASASTDYYTRGDYISGIYVDGMDVLAVREATRWAKEYILREKVPLVMELDTYRYYGHSMSDPGKSYRKSEEVQQFRKEKDAIKIAMSYLTSNNMATADELTSIQKTIQSEMKENVEFALTSQEPDMDQLYTDILVNTQAYPVRGCDPFTWGDSQVKSINI